ncbi:hypothetical protein WJX84_009138 [Apatococcus fuscideae]|uniref:Uncharacterized protein n=1 Tax=Apatococcus fuscideae TaxID=2026836 RepID=A0AAW1T5G9_9CHLO
MATIRPNKVLHIRNLPYETTEEELIELCQPFGKLVQTKLNVGANKNQAFVEFTDMNAAIQMVSYYASSADPAKVRGKTVYLQYSTRQEIVNSKTQGDTPSNVLLVTLEALMPDIVITIDTLHLVFSAFGFVCKIATFEKSAGFQALIQYADRDTAEQVRHHLDGRHIPRQLLNDTPNPPMLKISFSQHTDLNVKFQSHRSRDYTNPYLPVAPSAGDPNLANMGMSGGSSSGGNPADGNVLLCSIENQMYPVTVDPLHTVFSPYGAVQKIAIFEKNNGWQALIQYADAVSAANAKTALEGHAIYDGGYNRLKIAYSVHRDLNVKGNNERSRDYTLPEPGTSFAGTPMQPGGYAGNGFMGGADGMSVPAGTNLHITGEWPIDGTMKLTVYLLEQAMQKLEETGSDTVLGIFDLRQFTSANADFSYAVRLVDVFFTYYPKRLGQVLFVQAPWVFRPGWALMKPLLRKYAQLVRFVTVEDLEREYFTPETLPADFRKL